MIRPFPRHESQVVLSTPIFEVRADDLEHPVHGGRRAYYILQTPPYVNVVAITEAGEILLVRQWRHGRRAVGLEIPAGLVDPGESPEQAAARELREETGYEAERLTLLGAVEPNPAHQDNLSYTVLAEGCRKVAEPSFDEGEQIEVERADPTTLLDRVRRGEIASAMVICGLFWWLDHQKAIGGPGVPGG